METPILASRNLSCTPIPLGCSALSSRYSEKRSETQHRHRLKGTKKTLLASWDWYVVPISWLKELEANLEREHDDSQILCIRSTLESGLNCSNHPIESSNIKDTHGYSTLISRSTLHTLQTLHHVESSLKARISWAIRSTRHFERFSCLWQKTSSKEMPKSLNHIK